MASAGGFILNLTDERREEFHRSLSIYGQFSEAVREFEHGRNTALVCFVVAEDRKITHIASGSRGMRAGSGLRRLNVTSVQELTTPIAIDDVLAALPSRAVAQVRARFERSGLLPPKAFLSFVDTLVRIAPQSRQYIERYSAARRERIASLPRAVTAALAQQKEAIATALFLADIDRKPLQQWSPGGDGVPSSFLDGLPEARLREDPMIMNDLLQLPGHELLRTLPYGAAVFKGEHKHLTVILANRHALEATFGTDLIYYNETFKSFLMVQYKAMEREGSQDVFRLPNVDLTDEIQRMDRILVQLQNCRPDGSREGFRLTQNPFFLKFCPRLVLNPDDKGLVLGMYLPLDYWKLTEGHPTLIGSRGGRLLTYRNVGRYLDNSSFAALVAGAWVGTTVTQSAELEPIIREIVASNRAVVVAIKRDDDPFAGVRGQVSDYNPLEGLETGQDEEQVTVHIHRS